MHQYTLVMILAFAVVSVCQHAQADTDLANKYVKEYISNGVPHIIEQCLGESWPLNCQNGQFIRSGEETTFVDNNSGQKLSYQEFWYEGMELSYRAGMIASLSVSSSNWPTYLGLGIGTSRKRVVGLLGKPTSQEPDLSVLTYCTTELTDCASFEFGMDEAVTKITWSFYYD